MKYVESTSQASKMDVKKNVQAQYNATTNAQTGYAK